MKERLPEIRQSPLPDAEQGSSSVVKQPTTRLSIDASTQNAPLNMLLEDIGRISEDNSAQPAEQWTSTGTQISGDTSAAHTASARQIALQSLPPAPQMQRELRKYIRKEISQLRKEARQNVRIGKPGSAYRSSLLFARIRSLRLLLNEIVDVSYDILKRLFVRVFIDRQPIL